MDTELLSSPVQWPVLAGVSADQSEASVGSAVTNERRALGPLRHLSGPALLYWPDSPPAQQQLVLVFVPSLVTISGQEYVLMFTHVPFKAKIFEREYFPVCEC